MGEEKNVENISSISKVPNTEVIPQQEPFPEVSEALQDHAPDDGGPHREPSNMSSNNQLDNSDVDFILMNPSPLMDHLETGVHVPTSGLLPATLQSRDLIDKVENELLK